MDQLGVGNILDELGLPRDLKTGQESLTFATYLKLVDWTEPWLVLLLICHLFMFVVVVKSRNVVAIQSALGLLMLGIVYMSETINELAAEHWRLFAGHQYFDTKGFFISTVLSAPLLVNCLIIVINFLLQNYYIIRDIQQMKINKSMKNRKNLEKPPSKKEDKSEEGEHAPSKEKEDKSDNGERTPSKEKDKND